MIKGLSTMTAILVLGMAGPAFGDIVVTFTTDGTTSGGQVDGVATFDINTVTNTMTISVANTTSGIGAIAQTLTAVDFVITGITGTPTLTSVSVPDGFEDCSTGTCVAASSFFDHSANTATSSPYTWAYGSYFGGTGIAAGAGSLKPGGIVNSSVTATDGITNPNHNDYLMSDPTNRVVFSFSFTGTSGTVDVTSANFYWGTGATADTDTTKGVNNNNAPVPEPSTLILFSTALGLTGVWARYRRRRET